MGNNIYDKKGPCNTCPYRVDVPLRYWDIGEFKDLMISERDFFGKVYGCHKNDGRVCVGWLMDQDKRGFPSIALRMSLSNNNINRTYLDGLTCKSPLYESVEQMCEANYPEYFKSFFMEGRVTPENITEIGINEVFVFASNIQGVHGKGSAKQALKWGARWGTGQGLIGSTYAIPTRDYLGMKRFKTLDLGTIGHYVDQYIFDAKLYSYKKFLTTKIGCGYAGLTVEQVAPLFKAAVHVQNISLPKEFWDILNR